MEDDKRSIAIKASDQNGEIDSKNGLQTLTFSRSLQAGKMSSLSRTGGRQTANAGISGLCRSREKNMRCLISLVSHYTEGRMGNSLSSHGGERNNCLCQMQLIDQKRVFETKHLSLVKAPL